METQQHPAAPVDANPVFELPTTSPDGRQLTAKEQHETLLKNPDFRAAVTREGTHARALHDELIRQKAAADNAAAANPVLGLEPAKDASAYRLNVDTTSHPDAEAFDVAARGWLAAMGAPETIGNSLGEQVRDVATRLAHADDMTRSLYAQKGREALQRVYGPETAAVIGRVDKFLDAIEPKAPGLAEFLDDHAWLLSDAIIVQYLVQLADGQAARQ